ncbi:MAG: hypothetical protein GXP08_03810 [Gammaproteobacteria bacterium]|nr:hypothetical protein [Gammaproteobacteria bacterium]
MPIKVPVYSDENSLHHILLYSEEADGTFKRTQSEPLRLLRDNIDGVTSKQGDLVAAQFDKIKRNWQLPTISFHYGKPQSFYHFLREKVARNKFYVFTAPNLSGRITRLNLHELKLKVSVSQRILSILKEKYLEALLLWTREEYLEKLKAQRIRLSVSKTHKAKVTGPKRQNSQEAIDAADKDNVQRIYDVQRRTQIFMDYDNLSILPTNNEMPDLNAYRSTESTLQAQPKKKSDSSVDENNHLDQRFMIDME